MNGAACAEAECCEFVEVDPTGRYGRYNEILGKGASKTVYRAFDEYEGIEVAWNQVKLYDFLQNPEDLERLYSEIHLLKTLKHKNIMKFYTSWVDTANRHINFVTEMFTSGTLRQYRLKHRRVNIRAIKHWCRQILEGLLYLHSYDPPVIHRDLKCDNIFINGNQGEVKIGDLGLAAILRKSNAARCVGTPEFMAPEVYEEDYNELVDIYSFGMCILEMVTFEYPYSECNHPAQIYKKVVSGKKPEALYKVNNPEVRQFVEKCLATASLRLSAKELLEDPFLQIDDYGSDSKVVQYQRDCYQVTPLIRQPLNGIYSINDTLMSGYTDNLGGYGPVSELDYPQDDFEPSEIGLFECEEGDNLAEVDTTIKGSRREDDGIFLRIRIADKEGRVRNIYFPFDIETDTALSVANEMVAELDITDQDVTKLANMIDNEIATLVPEWKAEQIIEENSECSSANVCRNCAANGSLFDYVSSNNPCGKNLQFLRCSKNGCAAVHGRFEEITYQVEGSENSATEGEPDASRQSKGIHYTDIWAQRDDPELCHEELKDIHCDQAHEASHPSNIKEDGKTVNMDEQSDLNTKRPLSNPATNCAPLDYENEIRQELRWLKAKYQMQLRELRDHQLGGKPKFSSISPDTEKLEHGIGKDGILRLSATSNLKIQNNKPLLRSIFSGKHFHVDDEKCTTLADQVVQNIDEVSQSNSPEQMVTAQDFFTGALLPHSLHRATSLPVDAVDV
ncbi:probable serine/threonine-protein kinase WNK9 isoform X1 [Cajanus cajan]|uniref:probable serine/threonine-protein kinase WNK9 isoform X1 n=1 Tax=Cajanus cajan TaxID=3821 RepID=UPI00098DA89D|nr:probable serine/threonine-protein kinase WNK9 isoform X1 [Cajanus cajan]XP_029126478.1 probable serine/threonine-protein kinase WNK9 isoform X1 [Cajanus cajan]